MDEVSEGCVGVGHLPQLGGVEGDDEVPFGQLLIVRCTTRKDYHVVPRKDYQEVPRKDYLVPKKSLKNCSFIYHNILLSTSLFSSV